MLQGAQVRTFAEAPLQEPTVPTHGIHGRYALALFQAGIKEGDLDKIDKDLREVGIEHTVAMDLPVALAGETEENNWCSA